MAVGLTNLITEDTTTILTSVYDDLIRQSEQLRILKNYIKLDATYKGSIEELLEAIESDKQKEEPANE